MPSALLFVCSFLVLVSGVVLGYSIAGEIGLVIGVLAALGFEAAIDYKWRTLVLVGKPEESSGQGRVMATASRILTWCVMLIAACIFFFLFINLNVFDENLNPEAVAFAQPPKPRFQDKDNAYFALMGFQASEDQEPHAVGRKIVAEYEAWLAKKPFLKSFEGEPYLGGGKLSVKGKPSALCDLRKGECLARYMSQEAQVGQLLADNRTLLERYRLLYAYPHFEETATPSVAEPILAYPIVMVALVNAEIALHVKRGELAGALDLLDREISFWRRVLREGKGLVLKMAAARALYRNYRLLSDVINADAGIAREHYGRLEKMTTLLTAEETNIAACMRREWAMNLREMEWIRHERDSAIRESILNWMPGFQPHATMNEGYAFHKAYAELAGMPASQFPAAQKDLHEKLKAETTWWRLIYNPVGKILVYVSPVDYSPYIARLHDLDGYLRLVALQLQIGQRKLPDAGIPEFLKAAGQRYADPYTERPMQWDPGRGLIYFEGMSKQFDDADGGAVAIRIRASAARPATAN